MGKDKRKKTHKSYAKCLIRQGTRISSLCRRLKSLDSASDCGLSTSRQVSPVASQKTREANWQFYILHLSRACRCSFLLSFEQYSKVHQRFPGVRLFWCGTLICKRNEMFAGVDQYETKLQTLNRRLNYSQQMIQFSRWNLIVNQ